MNRVYLLIDGEATCTLQEFIEASSIVNDGTPLHPADVEAIAKLEVGQKYLITDPECTEVERIQGPTIPIVEHISQVVRLHDEILYGA